MFWDNPFVPPMFKGHEIFHNIPEEGTSHLPHGGSPKSHKNTPCLLNSPIFTVTLEPMKFTQKPHYEMNIHMVIIFIVAPCIL